MPGGDGTGPMGIGPMTGRGAGFCGGAGARGAANRRGNRGGAGRGGRGWRRQFYATGLTGWQRAMAAATPGAAPSPVAPAPDEELEALKQQAEDAAAALEAIRSRIAEVEAARTAG